MKKIGLVLVVLLILALAGTVRAETAEITFVNDCSFWIKVYVDGVPSGSVPPGDNQTTFASLGSHTLKAVTVQANPQTVTRSITLESGGFTWTLYEE
ncbi:MAG: hypothetical protein Q8O03_07425 [Nanoarchaeota archaeon]|nr:hypothetical protein [Nanoarchaeota archaeon]